MSKWRKFDEPNMKAAEECEQEIADLKRLNEKLKDQLTMALEALSKVCGS